MTSKQIRVKGYYKTINNKKVWVKSHIRNIKDKEIITTRIENEFLESIDSLESINWDEKYPDFSDKLSIYVIEDDPWDDDDIEIKREDIPREILNYNQNVLQSMFGDTIRLYRGINYPLDKVEEIMDDMRNKSSPWTTDKQTAMNFSESHYGDSVIVMADIPVNNILLSYLSAKQLYEQNEKEFIVDKHPNIKNIVYMDSQEFKTKYNLKDPWRD